MCGSLCKDQFSLVWSLSRVQLFATPWIAARQASLSITNSQSSLRFTSMESVTPSSHLILCRPLLLLPPIPPSIRVFPNESTLLMRWPKYWSFSFSIIPSKEIPKLISFRMDWLGLFAVQGTLKIMIFRNLFCQSLPFDRRSYSIYIKYSSNHIQCTVILLLVFYMSYVIFVGFSGGSNSKESTCNTRDLGSVPRWGRSPGERNGPHSSALA